MRGRLVSFGATICSAILAGGLLSPATAADGFPYYTLEKLPRFTAEGKDLAPAAIFADGSVLVESLSGPAPLYRWDGSDLTAYFPLAPKFRSVSFATQTTDGAIFFNAVAADNHVTVLRFGPNPATEPVDILAGLGLEGPILPGGSQEGFGIKDRGKTYAVVNGSVSELKPPATVPSSIDITLAAVNSKGLPLYLVHKNADASLSDWWRAYIPPDGRFAPGDATAEPKPEERAAALSAAFWGSDLITVWTILTPPRTKAAWVPTHARTEIAVLTADGTRRWIEVLDFDGDPKTAAPDSYPMPDFLLGDGWLALISPQPIPITTPKGTRNLVSANATLTVMHGSIASTVLRTGDLLPGIGIVTKLSFAKPKTGVTLTGAFLIEVSGTNPGPDGTAYFVARPHRVRP